MAARLVYSGLGRFFIPMAYTTIILSDNQPCQVKTLPLYALDHIGPRDIGDFTYKIKTLLGETFDQIYNLQARLEKPPEEPGPDEDDTWKLTEWERFSAALAHNQRRRDYAEERAENEARYILETCLSPEDRERVMTPDDYDAVYHAAQTPEVGREDVITALRDFFPGQV